MLELKIYSECIPCQAQIRFRDIQRVVFNEDERISLITKLLDLIVKEINEKGRNTSPAHLGTKLFRFIKMITGVDDPCEEMKRIEYINGLKLYNTICSELKKLDINKRIVKSIKLALIGNALDLDVAGYVPPNTNQILNEVETIIVRGTSIESIIDVIKNARIITFVLDNTGEAALDKLLSESLRDLGIYTVAIVKSGAFQNDITIKEAKYLELSNSFDEVVETGTDAASIFLDELAPKAKRVIDESDILISKGMANFEYISEIEKIINKPIIYMLKTKCRPVTMELRVDIGDYVINVTNIKHPQ